MALEDEQALQEHEAKVFGCDHADVSAMIADHWRLPERIVQAIAHHHAPYLPDGESRRLVIVIKQVEAWGRAETDQPDEITPLVRLSEDMQAQIHARAQQQTELYEQILVD
jgi:HD-like signal output (HDOD) protein